MGERPKASAQLQRRAFARATELGDARRAGRLRGPRRQLRRRAQLLPPRAGAQSARCRPAAARPDRSGPPAGGRRRRSGSCSTGPNRGVELRAPLAGRPLAAEVHLGVGARGRAQRAPQIRLAVQPPDRRGQRGRVAGCDHQAGTRGLHEARPPRRGRPKITGRPAAIASSIFVGSAPAKIGRSRSSTALASALAIQRAGSASDATTPSISTLVTPCSSISAANPVGVGAVAGDRASAPTSGPASCEASTSTSSPWASPTVPAYSNRSGAPSWRRARRRSVKPVEVDDRPARRAICRRRRARRRARRRCPPSARRPGPRAGRPTARAPPRRRSPAGCAGAQLDSAGRPAIGDVDHVGGAFRAGRRSLPRPP